MLFSVAAASAGEDAAAGAAHAAETGLSLTGAGSIGPPGSIAKAEVRNGAPTTLAIDMCDGRCFDPDTGDAIT